MAPPLPDPVQYARTADGIVVVRVIGKATHLQSPSLRHVFELTKNAAPPPRYVFDLDRCTAMDSTFMGILASIALHQRRAARTPVILTNLQDHVRRLLETLGLMFILELRPGPDAAPPHVPSEQFEPVPAPAISTIDRIVMMIEAHQRLIDIDSDNEVRFKGVVSSLKESFDLSKDQDPDAQPD